MFKQIPNILTIIRFLLIPIIILLAVQNNYIGAIIVFTISGITDILDGVIARKFNFISDFGKLMDPLADKTTQIALLGTLMFKGIIPIWILVVVLLKELMMISGASFLYGKELVVSSKWYGKTSTVLFYIAIVIAMAERQFENILIEKYGKTSIILNCDKPIFYLAIAMTIFSLIMYMKAFYIKGYIEKAKEKNKSFGGNK